MSAIKITSISLAGITGIGIPATATAYYKDRETIWDTLEEDLLPSDESISSWDLLQKELSGKQDLNDAKLKNLSSGEELKNWCAKAYSTEYRSIFKNPDESLKSDAKKVCILSIKKKLGDNALSTESSSDESVTNAYKANLKQLKGHSIKVNGSLEKELEELRTEIQDNQEEKWEKLKNWCAKAYEKSYKGEAYDLWKLASKFCRKSEGQ